MRLSFNEVSGEDARWPRNQKVILTFALWDEESWAIDMYNQSLTFTYDQIRRRTKQAITLGGAIVGFNDLEVCPILHFI